MIYSQNGKVETIYGTIDEKDLSRFLRIAGHRWHDKNGLWSLISDKVEYWHLESPASGVESKKWKKRTGYLPIRDFNFQYALARFEYEKDGKVFQNIEKALDYAEKELFNLDGTPVYLPDKLAIKAGKLTDEKHFSYNKLLTKEL